MKRHLKRTAVGGVVIAALVVSGLSIFYRYYYIPHFSVVQEGAIYRSGQPNARQLQRLRDDYGVRTVVNLRKVAQQNDREGMTFEEERAEVDRLGLRFIHLPWDGAEHVDPNVVSQWLEIAQDRDNWPILLHCKQGVDRTGLLVAVYRIRVQGWSPQRALDEAVAERMDTESKAHMRDYILACPNRAR